MLAVASVSAILISCGSKETKETTSEMKDTVNTMVAGVQYTCPMHPEVQSDKPGSCPKCGMDLVKKETSGKSETMPDSTMKSDSAAKMKM
jgi:Cu(I)/Ag(I) efflux system membrane fusion protein